MIRLTAQWKRVRSASRTLALLTLLLAVPAHAEGLGHPRDAVDVFVKATAAGDPDALAALYAPNAIFLAPDTPVVSGRDEIRKVFARNFAAGPNTIAFTDVLVDGEGTRALILWSWNTQISPPGRDPVRLSGRSLVYFIRGETGWLISADMMQVTTQR
ncbi:MAG: SgcJ/EcaC family oxidoreductase [Rhizobiaceae bacterium]